jgi:hypothetical protein
MEILTMSQKPKAPGFLDGTPEWSFIAFLSHEATPKLNHPSDWSLKPWENLCFRGSKIFGNLHVFNPCNNIYIYMGNYI